MEDAQLARAVGDTQNTPATEKEDIHAPHKGRVRIVQIIPFKLLGFATHPRPACDGLLPREVNVSPG